MSDLPYPFKVIYSYNSPLAKFRLLKNYKSEMIYPQYQKDKFWRELNYNLICTPIKNGEYIGDKAVTKIYSDVIDDIVKIIITKTF